MPARLPHPVLRPSLALLVAALGAAWAVPQAARAQPAGLPVPPAQTMAGALRIAERLGVQAVPLQPGEQIKLDGTLSHPAWQRAPVFNQFTEKDPVMGEAPRYETRLQVLYDQRAIYVGVTCLDDHPEQIRGPLVRHDGVNRTQDFVAVILDPIGKRQSAQFFRVNAGGSIADGIYTAADDGEDFSPDFDFDAAAARNEQGWTGVFRIPFASLRFSDDPLTTWRLLVVRRVPREQFYMWTSAPVPNDAPAFIATMPALRGVQLPDEKTFLTVRPSVTLKHTSQQDAGEPTHTESRLEGSLDLKWRLRPEWVVDATLKPDFSQVALDVPQLSGNSSFALYLPEKRPFFFESADLLRSPTDALYTRSFTAPQWGLRSTWRSATMGGAAFMVDDKGGGSTLLPGAYGTDSATQPGSRTLALRGRMDGPEGRGFEVGGVLAARRYDQDRGENTVLGPDVDWQIDDLWHLRAQWLNSRTTAQPDGDGGLQRGAATTGNFLRATLGRHASELTLDWEAERSDPGFRHDSGFFNQVGIRVLGAHQGWGWRQLGPLNEFWLQADEKIVTDAQGQVVQRYLTPGTWISGPHNSGLNVQWRGFSQVRPSEGGPLLRERYLHLYGELSPAPWMPMVEGWLNTGRMADFSAQVVRSGLNGSLTLKTRPLPAVEFEPSVWTARLRDDAGPLTYREVAGQVLGIWHLDARQNLRLIVQRSSYDRKAEPARGVSTGRDSGLTSSLTYAWRESMGTVLYVGATHSRNGVGVGEIGRGSEVFVKLQADVDEIRRRF